MALTYGAIFAFDAPGSTKSIITKMFAFSLAVVPVVLLISCIGGLICAFGRQNGGKILVGRIFVLGPIVNLMLILLSIALLHIFCSGRFVCDV